MRDEVSSLQSQWPAPDAPAFPPFSAPYRAAIESIGRRWSGSILRVLLGGPHRFQQLLDTVPGLSDRLLTERLRELEDAGLVTRQVLPGRPIRAEYALTPAGRELEPVLRALSAWTDRWQSDAPPPG